MVASLRSQSSLEILLASLGSSAAIAATGCAASFALIGLPLRLFLPLAAAKLRPHWAYFALLRSTIRNSRLAALPLAILLPLSSAWSPLCVRKAHLRYSLLHWAHRRLLQPLAAPPLSPSLDFRFACFRHWRRRSSVPQGARFVLPSVRHSRLPSLAELAWDTPCLTGLTSACFAHCARPSCAPFFIQLCGFTR